MYLFLSLFCNMAIFKKQSKPNTSSEWEIGVIFATRPCQYYTGFSFETEHEIQDQTNSL